MPAASAFYFERTHMPKRNNEKHVVRNQASQWEVKQGGFSISVHRTQAEAENSAIRLAKIDGTEVVVHGRDGKIRSKDSYGNDPRSIKDREH